MIELGDKAKHVVTGFEGIVTSLTSYLSGCDSAGIRPQKLHEGKPIDIHYFDVTLLEVTKKGAVTPNKEMKRNPGGPHDSPSRGSE